jgi:cell division protein FtsI/penicillin-binding protein 2
VADQKAEWWRATVGRLVLVLAAFFGLWVAAIEGRLVYLQVFQRAEYQTIADKAHRQKVSVPARRGEILDRHGRVLAYSVAADTIFAVPSAISDPARTVEALCGALGNCTARDRETLAERLGRKSSHFAYVQRQVTAAQKAHVQERIDLLKLTGVDFRTDPQRAYPNNELAAHVLGYVGIDERNETDSKGLGGIESAHDGRIAGKPGDMVVQVDAKQNVVSRIGTPPSNGQTIELTIDEVLQHIAERELEAGVAENRAAGGCVVMMDPYTGEILALASAPTFDPNAFRESDETDRRNRCVQDLYEPGSTFKMVTASAALEEGVLRPSDMIDVSAGRIQIGRWRVVEDVHRYGVLSFTDVIVKSSNVGAIKIGLRRGRAARPLRSPIRVRDEAVARLPGRERRDRLEPDCMDRQRSGIGVDGISDRRDGAADGDRRERGRERRRPRAAPRRAGPDQGRRPDGSASQQDQAGNRAGHRRRAHDDDGGRGRPRNGDRRTSARVHDCGQDRHSRQTRQRDLFQDGLQLLVHRLSSSRAPVVTIPDD